MAEKLKKVLALASTFPRWPEDTTPPFVYELEKRLTSDFDVYVLAPHFSNAKKYEESEGLKIYRYQYFWPASSQTVCYQGGILSNLKKNKLNILQVIPLIFLQIFWAVVIIKRHNIDVLHAHWAIPQGITALVCKKLLGIPYILTSHGSDIFGLGDKYWGWLKKAILRNASAFTVVSSAMKQYILETVDPDINVVVAPMGVDSRLFNPEKADHSLKTRYGIKGPFLLFVGRLSDTKGVEYLISAMPSVLKSIPEAKLLIIGEGSERKRLQKLASSLQLNDRIVFTGAVPNSHLPEYYATADLFVGPSIVKSDGRKEGFGLTFVEASFCECVPVGTNTGGITDVITHGKTGLLVKEKDPADLAETITKALEDKNLLNEMKKTTRASNIEKFDWQVVAGKYRNIYETVGSKK